MHSAMLGARDFNQGKLKDSTIILAEGLLKVMKNGYINPYVMCMYTYVYLKKLWTILVGTAFSIKNDQPSKLLRKIVLACQSESTNYFWENKISLHREISSFDNTN